MSSYQSEDPYLKEVVARREAENVYASMANRKGALTQVGQEAEKTAQESPLQHLMQEINIAQKQAHEAVERLMLKLEMVMSPASVQEKLQAPANRLHDLPSSQLTGFLINMAEDYRALQAKLNELRQRIAL